MFPVSIFWIHYFCFFCCCSYCSTIYILKRLFLSPLLFVWNLTKLSPSMTTFLNALSFLPFYVHDSLLLSVVFFLFHVPIRIWAWRIHYKLWVFRKRHSSIPFFRLMCMFLLAIAAYNNRSLKWGGLFIGFIVFVVCFQS